VGVEKEEKKLYALACFIFHIFLEIQVWSNLTIDGLSDFMYYFE